MLNHNNTARARRVFGEVQSQGNTALIKELVTSDDE